MTTLLDKIKTDTPAISDGFKDLASKISTMAPDDYPKKWLEFAKSFDVTDKSAVKFFSDVDSGKRDISDIDDYMNSASQATSAFSATLKSVAANMAINAVIKAVAWAWDEFNTTVAVI